MVLLKGRLFFLPCDKEACEGCCSKGAEAVVYKSINTGNVFQGILLYANF